MQHEPRNTPREAAGGQGTAGPGRGSLAAGTIVLALMSVAITLVVAIATLSDGRMPGPGAVALVGALGLAALAAGQAVRPPAPEQTGEGGAKEEQARPYQWRGR